MSFDSLGLSPKVLAAVEAAGYTTPTPIQENAIPCVLERRDVLGIAQTGTGKTAAFTLPIINTLLGGERRVRTLILTPTRELCMQVTESFEKYGKYSNLKVVAVFGGVALGPQQDKLRRGVFLDGSRTLPAEVRRAPEGRGAPGRGARGATTTLVLTLVEGRNRQVRRMCASIGHPVRRLTRIRMGPITLGHLRRGQWRDLTEREVAALRAAAGG